MTLRIDPVKLILDHPSPLLAIHDSWKRIRLGDVADIDNGYAFRSVNFNAAGKGMPIIRIRDVGSDNVPSTWYEGPYEERYLVNPGDIVVGMDGDFRIAPWQGPPALLNQRVCRIRIRQQCSLDERFMLYAMPGYLKAIHEHTSSITVKHLSWLTVADIPLPAPPLAEQRRITDAIDSLFSRLDMTDKILTGIIRRVGKLKFSLQETLWQANYPVVEVQKAAAVRLGRQRTPKNHSGPNMRPYLRAANVTWDGLDLSDVKSMQFSPEESTVYELQRGDVLVVEASGSRKEVGKAAIWRDELQGCCFQNTLIRLRPSDKVVPEYLHLVMENAASSGALGRAATGIGIHHLGAQRAGSWRIPLPNTGEQRRIVRQSEEWSSGARRAARSASANLIRSKKLRDRILDLAFCGQLVPQCLGDRTMSLASMSISSDVRAVTVG